MRCSWPLAFDFGVTVLTTSHLTAPESMGFRPKIAPGQLSIREESEARGIRRFRSGAPGRSGRDRRTRNARKSGPRRRCSGRTLRPGIAIGGSTHPGLFGGLPRASKEGAEDTER
jgi:hypothetical protein